MRKTEDVARLNLPSYAGLREICVSPLEVRARTSRWEFTGDAGKSIFKSLLEVVVVTSNTPPEPDVEIRLISASMALKTELMIGRREKAFKTHPLLLCASKFVSEPELSNPTSTSIFPFVVERTKLLDALNIPLIPPLLVFIKETVAASDYEPK